MRSEDIFTSWGILINLPLVHWEVLVTGAILADPVDSGLLSQPAYTNVMSVAERCMMLGHQGSNERWMRKVGSASISISFLLVS